MKYGRIGFLVVFALFFTINLSQAISLWKVEGPEGALYLLGSVHVLDESAYPLPQAMRDAFTESQRLVLEVDMAEMADPAVVRRVAAIGLLQPPETLADALGAELFGRVEDRLQDLSLDAAMFQPFKPWFFSMTLTQMALQKQGFSAEQGVDLHFYQQAVERGLEIIGLETMEQQLMMLDGLPPNEQRDMVSQTVDELPQLSEQFEQMIQVWRQGDLQQIDTVLLSKFRDFPALYQRLIRQRNNAWFGPLQTLMNGGGTSLVVVGAAHMAGEDGLVALFSRAGYTVSQY